MSTDIGKIAREAVHNYLERGDNLEQYILQALTQAREPLVAALQQIIEMESNSSPGCYTKSERVARAALTSTGEKKCTSHSF